MDFKATIIKVPSAEKLNPKNVASLSRSVCFLWRSDCLSAFFCIADNSETFPYTVIKDEFSSPVEKAPQFGSDRLYFIMRWKNQCWRENQSMDPATHKRLSNIICFSVVAHCERGFCSLQIFLALSVFSEQTAVTEWQSSLRSQTLSDRLGHLLSTQKPVLTRGPAHCRSTTHSRSLITLQTCPAQAEWEDGKIHSGTHRLSVGSLL